MGIAVRGNFTATCREDVRGILLTRGANDGDPANLEEQLVRDESLRLKPYRDSAGKLTIGVGRNLNDVGISREEAMAMLANDIEHANALSLSWANSLKSVIRERIHAVQIGVRPATEDIYNPRRDVASMCFPYDCATTR